jgi:RNA polymerase sigma factor (TIGR02999 family)
MVATREAITKLVNSAAAGDEVSMRELLSLIYDELRAMARAKLQNAPPGTSLHPTELVHEAYMRLFDHPPSEGAPAWNSRGHFFAAAAQAMRNILVDQARRKQTIKRGGDRKRVELGEHELAIEPPADDVLAVDEVLSQLERNSPRKAKLILLHCFSGLTLEETAAAMDLSLSTVEREWRFTRALLQSKLEEGESA